MFKGRACGGKCLALLVNSTSVRANVYFTKLLSDFCYSRTFVYFLCAS